MDAWVAAGRMRRDQADVIDLIVGGDEIYDMAEIYRVILRGAPDINVVAGLPATTGDGRRLVVLERVGELTTDYFRRPRFLGIAAKYGARRMLMMAVKVPTDAALAGLRAGVRGIARFDTTPEFVRQYVVAVADGHAVIEPCVLGTILDAYAADFPAPELDVVEAMRDFTDRECEVLTLLASGLANVEIARALGVAEATVKFHVHNLRHKLAVQERTQMAAFAFRTGIVRPRNLRRAQR
ncbi:hypothetical protein GCM10009558_013750 [Virgisporangium aurantiacum]